MVPQPGHGVPGYIIPRKRVGASGGMWLLGTDLASREQWNDSIMCKTTGGRDLETSSGTIMCNSSLDSFKIDFGVNVAQGVPRSRGKDRGDHLEQTMSVTAMLSSEDRIHEGVNTNFTADGNAISNRSHESEVECEEEETSPEVEAKVPGVQGDDFEPDMGFDDLYSLLEKEPLVQQDSDEVTKIEMDQDMKIREASKESTDLTEECATEQPPSYLSPQDEDATRLGAQSPVQEDNDMSVFLFFPSSAQEEAMQSGTGPLSPSTADQEFLSLSSSTQDFSHGASEGYFRQSENDAFLLLSSPDEDSWHSAPSRTHNVYDGVTSPLETLGERNYKKHQLDLVSFDTSKSLGFPHTMGSMSQIDHERPIQTYGSVLASSTNFTGTISALDCTNNVFLTSSSSGGFNRACGPSAIVDLTEDSDDDEVIEQTNPYGKGGVLGKRRVEDFHETERRKRLATAGSSEQWRHANLELRDQRSRLNAQNPIYPEEWLRESLDKSIKMKQYASGIAGLRPLHWDLPGTSYFPPESSPLTSSFNSSMAGGRSVHYSDRGGSMQISTPFDIDHKRHYLGGHSMGSLLPNHGGQSGLVHSGLRDEKEKRALKAAVLQQTVMVDNNKETTPDPGLLSVQLLKHQRIALNWMEEREAKKGLPCGGILADDQGLGKTISTISLILKARAPLRKRSVEASDSSQLETATVNLDDDDDVHTVRGNPILATSAGEKDDGSMQTDGISREMRPEAKRAQEDVKMSGSKGRPAAGTLVVCPTSVLRQWGHELKEKVTQLADLSVLVYHGSNRTKDPDELAKYDVVLTTYSIVSMEVPKQPLPDERDVDKKNPSDFDVPPPFRATKPKKPKKTPDNSKKGRGNGKGRLVESENGSVDSGPLARVNWFRVVLDEAQSIKNARTQVARAAWGLRAKRRWCLSGTPIQNAVDDLYSYFRFLRYAPYDGYKIFREKIKDPVTRTPAEGYKALQGLLSAVMLRRTKDTLIDGKPIVNLPARIVTLKQTEFSDEERTFYTNLETESRKQFQDYAEAGTLQSNYVNILWMLLRLRQACDHPLLVKGHKTQGAQKVVMDSARALPTEQRMQLLNLLEGNRAICPLCNDLPDEAVVCICSHIFCRQCISEQLATGDDNCCPIPKCRKPLSLSLVFTLASLKSCEVDESSSSANPILAVDGTPDNWNNGDDLGTGWKTSSKINAVIETLSALPKITVVVENGKVVAEVSKDLEDVKLVDTSNVSIAELEPALSELITPTKTLNLTSDNKMESLPCSIESNQGSGISTQETKANELIVKHEINSAATVCKDTVSRTFVQSTEKAIVFSQWTSMLDLLEVSLKHAKFNYRRLDGTMSVLARDRAVAEFKTLPEVTVIIMSLKAASLGLNMVAACHVLLLDVWWNPTTEDQAIDRAHRIGQTRTVRVSRFTVRNTIEDRILALQERKRQIVASAFGDGEAGGQKGTRLSAADLEYLFHI